VRIDRQGEQAYGQVDFLRKESRLSKQGRLADLATASVLMLLYLVATPVGSAQAAVSCGIQSATHSGRAYDPSGYRVRGAEAEIDVRSGVLCQGGNGPDTFATSWVMMVRGDLTGYAQVGHMFKNTGTSFRFFYEFDRQSSTPFTRVFWGNPVSGNHHNYRAARNTGDGHIHFTVEGNNPPGGGETPFDPFDYWTDIFAEWSSETAHIGSDVPGTPSNRVDYQFVHHKNNNETWTLQNYVPLVSACYFSVAEVTSDSHFRSWTNDPLHACD